MNQSVVVTNMVYELTKEVRFIFPDAICIPTFIPGENSFIIYRYNVKGVIGVLLGKGATPLEAWSNVKHIIDTHGPKWYFERRR